MNKQDTTPLATVLSEENYHQILDSLGDMVLVKGPQSKLLWANKAFCNFYGMSNEQLRGLIDAPFVEPDFTLNYVRDDAHVFNTGTVLDIPEEPVTRHDGVIHYFHTIKTPIFGPDGKVIMTVGISRDITEIKRAKEQIETERANMINASKMATLGEMAAGIAHEINTPLAIIHSLSGQAAELLTEEATPDKPMLIKMAQKIESTAARIAKIISGLKNFSRSSGAGTSSRINLRTLIEETLSFSRERLTHQSIAVEMQGVDPALEIMGDSTQLAQVVLNLVNNAHDAIRALEGEKWIRFESVARGDVAEITVTDSGKGIPKAVAEKIFQPFFTTKEIGKGTGLGLSISKGIIEAHSGTLSVDASCANTRFVIRLPKR